MKSTLLFICSLFCLLFFTADIMTSGLESVLLPPDEAWSQVANPQEASVYLGAQCAFNFTMGAIMTGICGASVLGAIISLFFLKKQRILRWFRVGLLTANIIILLCCCILFGITLVETLQPEPACLQLIWPWKTSYWATAVHHTHQQAMFLSFCCGILSSVNCAAFYLFYNRQRLYGHH